MRSSKGIFKKCLVKLERKFWEKSERIWEEIPTFLRTSLKKISQFSDVGTFC